jgi:hypothetical protein
LRENQAGLPPFARGAPCQRFCLARLEQAGLEAPGQKINIRTQIFTSPAAAFAAQRVAKVQTEVTTDKIEPFAGRDCWNERSLSHTEKQCNLQNVC